MSDKIKEHICGKCHKPFHSLRAGMDYDYFRVLETFIDYCYKDGVTDRNCQISTKSWLKGVEKRFTKKEKLFQLIKELLDGK